MRVSHKWNAFLFVSYHIFVYQDCRGRIVYHFEYADTPRLSVKLVFRAPGISLSCLEGDEFGADVSKRVPFSIMLTSQACILFRGADLKIHVLKLFL